MNEYGKTGIFYNSITFAMTPGKSIISYTLAADEWEVAYRQALFGPFAESKRTGV